MRTFTKIVLTLLTMGVTHVGAQQPSAKAPPTARPKVVFVCEHGSAKSVMAAAEFERLAKKNGLAVEVIGRGSNPDAEVDVPIRQHLLADGMDIGQLKPLKVTSKDLAGASKVVTFGPDLTTLLPKGLKVLDWSATPSPGKEYQASRAYILKQLEALIVELKSAPSK